MTTDRISNAIVTIVVAAVVAFATTNYFGNAGSRDSILHSGTELGGVLETSVIRCGYVAYPPGLIKDPNSGEISGIFAEVLVEAASNLGMTVEWTEEVGWGTMVEGLKANRYDMICSPVWPLSQRARVADFSQPVYYGGAEAYAREDDKRFDKDLSLLNDHQFTIATTDGEVTDTIAQKDFPKADRLSLPQLTDVSQLLLSVAKGKADVTFVEPYVAYEFQQNNPNTIKAVRPGDPLRIYPNTMMLKLEDMVFRRMLNNAIDELHNNGFISHVLLKYEPYQGAFYRKLKPIER